MGFELMSDRRAMIPRKETELLGNKAHELSVSIADTKDTIKVFDVCCGSGNLGIVVAKLNSKCIIYSTDISKEATELAMENVNNLELQKRITVRQGDLFSAYESFEFYDNIDLIICNPPYIQSSKVSKMDREITSNEPSLAFDGGMLGIKIIRNLISEAPKFLSKDGWLCFEVGLGQGPFILQMCQRNGFYKNIGSISDNLGNIRVLYAQKT